MAAKIQNMAEGKPLPLIVNFALPLMAGSIFQQLYVVVDTMVVGNALGVDALAALGATDWLNFLILGMIQGVTQGFAILMAREFGAGHFEKLRQVTGSSLILSCLCAAVLLAAGQLSVRPVLELLHTPPRIISGSVLYLRIMFGGIPIVMAYNLLASILRSLGDSKTPLSAMIVAAIGNVILDLLFVLVFHWGIAGAAVATLLAQLISCGFCLLRILRIDFMTLTRDCLRPNLPLSAQLMSLGWPMALQNGIIAIGGMIIQSVVNGYGVTFIAGYTATFKLYGILELAAISYGYAMITYVSQNLGAGMVSRIRQGMRSATAVALGTSVVIGGLMLLLGRSIVSLFISGSPEETDEAIQIAYTYLSTMSIFLPVLYILHVIRSAIQGLGNTILPMVSGIAEFIMRTGSALLLSAYLGQSGIFLAEVLAWLGADLILIPSYFITMAKVSRRMPESGQPNLSPPW